MYHITKIFLLISLITLCSFEELDNSDKSWSRHFLKKVEEAKKLPRRTLAVAGAEEETTLKSCIEGYNLGLVEPILVGDENKIKEVAKENNLDISKFQIINEPDRKHASKAAVKLVLDKKAEMLMKGIVSAADFITTITSRKFGETVRTGRPLSHVEVCEIEGIDQLLLMTDGAVNLYPSLEEKMHITYNAIEIAKGLGINMPKVAVLSATELINPALKSALDAYELVQMNEKAALRGCIVDGPLSLDMAISKKACLKKEATDRKIQGDADVLLFPSVESHSIAWQFLMHTSRHLAAHMLVGASVPIIMTGRADDLDSHVHSMAIGSILCEFFKDH